MKKQAFLFTISIFAFLVFLSLTSLVIAQGNATCGAGDNSCKINKAYSCLEGKINNKGCSQLSPGERVFSLLATGKCKNEVKNDAEFMSDIKFTAQAIIALKNSGSNISDEESWLISQNRTATGLNWFLEIESPKATKCTVSYSSSNKVNFGENKKISSLSGGNCLSSAQGGYWLEVSPNCYNENFTISCDQSFLTTLLFKKQGSSTIFVSDLTNSASAEGTTEEKVNSFCFGKGNSCNYEATLWSALALSFLNKDITPYLSYLTVMEGDNKNFFPESFLYYLTANTDFENQILSEQINSKWWISSNDKYYGTALALFALQYEEPQQKTDAVNWLFNEAQGKGGCWDSGNIRNTAFLLYALSPKSYIAGSNITEGNITEGNITEGNITEGNITEGNITGGSTIDCEDAGYTCASQINCAGEVLSGYSCSGAFVCCTAKKTFTCSEQEGEICNSDQNCVGVSSFTVNSSDLSLGQSCCLKGTCQKPQQQVSSACESSGGICRVSGCSSSEEKTAFACEFSSDSCCVQKPVKNTSYVWIWVFGILIILVILAIFFRDKLRPYWFRLKSKFGGSKSQGNKNPRFPPSSPYGSPFIHRNLRRRIIPPPQRRPPISKSRPKGEIDEVLKKLKEMGK